MIKTVKCDKTSNYKYFEGYVNMTKVRINFMSKNPDKLKKEGMNIKELTTSVGYKNEFDIINKNLEVGIPTSEIPYYIAIKGNGNNNLE